MNCVFGVAIAVGLGLAGGAPGQSPYDGYGGVAAPAAPGAEEAVVTLIDEHGDERTFDADDLAKLPRQTVKAPDQKGAKTYEGVSLADVLQHFGVGFGDKLRGRRTPVIVLCEARDGYRVALSLVEIDPATTDALVLLADRRDGQLLAGDEGPFRFIIPADKRGVRSIRMLRMIRVVNLADMPMTQRFDEKPASPSK